MPIWTPIPGETPIDDISGLIPAGITTRRQLNLVEAENIRQTIIRYLAAKPSKRQAPFTLVWLFKLHQQMFGKVWKWAGTKRHTELNIGVPAGQIDVNLQNMLDDLEYWTNKKTMDLIEQSARLHHRAVAIHPFINGNGRWARLLANIWLKRNASPIISWPDEAVGSESIIRRAYLNAIKAADHGEITALIELHRKFSQ